MASRGARAGRSPSGKAALVTIQIRPHHGCSLARTCLPLLHLQGNANVDATGVTDVTSTDTTPNARIGGTTETSMTGIFASMQLRAVKVTSTSWWTQPTSRTVDGPHLSERSGVDP
jgi:hypothetical protein